MRPAYPERLRPGLHRCRHARAGRFALLLGLALLVGPALPTRATGPRPGQITPAAAAPVDPTTVQRSTRDLGNLLCAAYDSYCSTVWRLGMKRGQPFNLLIAETCAWVFFRESDDAGIACAETGIRAVPRLPDAVLVQGQFVPGERELHAYWRHQSDRQWARVATEYIQRIPYYCDQATPIIYNYFPCLLRELQYFQTILKEYGPVGPGFQRS